MKSRHLAVMIIGLLIASSFAVILVDDTDASDDVAPAYDTLSEKQKKAYDDLRKGVSSYSKNIPISGITVAEGEVVRAAFTSDNPEY